jgi:hypothetical protein
MHNNQSDLYKPILSIGLNVVNQKRGGKDKVGSDGRSGGKPPEKPLSSAERLDSEGAIGTGLRSLYQQVVKEPLPDDILALLEQLGSVDTKDG